ncbi:C50 carotenoid epsilon cyclase [Frigoribacterium sp. Leaf263]|uniref:lycopene cyclase domain-containing protein n=1 Tax=Frigoribacterium sp. Leaf263 TaxID=1736313 RepID=UPI0006F6D72B|nr:lycopene cyclase domain-containing protein [Frigoribacterium sp. Leaf263]KQO81085.1 C50 carotenoid epsilon cyclase [Frigoribacterium sp. Leaf263]
MGALYLVALGISLFGMAMLDRRFTLFFWRDAGRAFVTLLIGVVFFLIWDIVGIDAGVFFRGETSFMTGIQIAPELPLEEVFFLTLLCYLTMNLLAGTRLIVDRRASARDASARDASARQGGTR